MFDISRVIPTWEVIKYNLRFLLCLSNTSWKLSSAHSLLPAEEVLLGMKPGEDRDRYRFRHNSEATRTDACPGNRIYLYNAGGRRRLGRLYVDESIMLKYILEKQDEGMD
jgi:hypothetical protein